MDIKFTLSKDQTDKLIDTISGTTSDAMLKIIAKMDRKELLDFITKQVSFAQLSTCLMLSFPRNPKDIKH